jgi:tRNA(fMet)-specific endonuclease VapC
MRIALDTNRYSDFARGIPEVVAVLQSASEILIPFAVMAELSIGFRRGNRRVENETLLAGFLGRPGVSILYPDATTSNVFASLSCELLQNGTAIPIHDIWIAALTLQHGLVLYARDKHFDRLPQVRRI